MAQPKITDTGALNPATTMPTRDVTLMNFSDHPQAFSDSRSRIFLIGIGETVTKNMTESMIERIQRRIKSIIVLTPDIADNVDAPHMRLALDALRNFATMKEVELHRVADKVFGRGFLGPNPKRDEIRFALSKRVKDAASFIQMGALDAAEKILGRDNPDPEPTKAAHDEDKADLVTGDDMDDEDDDFLGRDDEGTEHEGDGGAGSSGGRGDGEAGSSRSHARSAGAADGDVQGDRHDRADDDEHPASEARAGAGRRAVRPEQRSNKRSEAPTRTVKLRNKGKGTTKRVQPKAKTGRKR